MKLAEMLTILFPAKLFLVSCFLTLLSAIFLFLIENMSDSDHITSAESTMSVVDRITDMGATLHSHMYVHPIQIRGEDTDLVNMRRQHSFSSVPFRSLQEQMNFSRVWEKCK